MLKELQSSLQERSGPKRKENCENKKNIVVLCVM
jgi:hypothetical protein